MEKYMGMDRLTSAFALLKSCFPAYEERPEQQEMTRAVMRSLSEGTNLLIEAGTGVGKSFAYLVPAILSGEKTVVSTSSLALQDQLVKNDLVSLKKVLPQRFTFSVLKGRNNYLCLKKERDYRGEGKSYDRFRRWFDKTKTGEKSELSFVPRFWSDVSGDPQECTGRICPFYGACFYYRHYRQLYNVDILVVNHHLLIYDVLADFHVLPFHNRLIIDEASEIEEVISQVFGSAVSLSRTTWLLSRLKGLKIIVDPLFTAAESFFKNADAPRETVTPIPPYLIEELKRFRNRLDLKKTAAALETRKNWTTDEELRERIERTMGALESFSGDMDNFIAQNDSRRVFYVTAKGDGLEFKSSLVEPDHAFRSLSETYGSVILTSATLAPGSDFSFIKNRLGIGGFEEKIVDSPFDYRKKALLYVNKDLPEPEGGNDRAFQESSLAVIDSLIEASRGRALVLFTSYRHLAYAAARTSISYPFKSQGDMPPAKLISWFRKTPHSILFATSTFWQGIDIRGDDLSLVVIVRLPFSPPGDPLYRERCRRLGSLWFQEYALPSAILMLRQGFGRLIRSHDDFGVVAILDRRVVKSSYGGRILASLPPAPITFDMQEVIRFFDSLPESEPAKKKRKTSVRRLS
ncbi:MAG: hypothetical protein M0P57_04445 [Syntrophales bacterium]|nr:hypothetical protein [Syntrophales bacterium]